ncbi:MAG TPA: hypothetical protein VK072_07215 [Candidatus Avamphibacillus sp.]|nr:hypothetical protein [Candidatus Avamphibacillus sp.]
MKNLYSIFFIVFVVALSGCGAQNSNDAGNVETTSEKSKVNETNNHDENNESELNNNGKEVEEEENNEEETDYDKWVDKDIDVGKTFEIEEKSEVTLQHVELTDLVKPPNPDGIYSYYEVEEDDAIYLDVVIDIKNLRNSGRSSDDFVNVRVMYENKYEYYGFSTIEVDGGTDLSYTNITSIDPLKTATLHYIVELPDEVEENPEDIKVIIDADNNEHYHYDFVD